MEEIWKDINGYEGLYQVSNLGNIISLNYRGNNGKINNLKLILHSKGYYQVGLRKNGYRKKYLVHRLVAQEFIQNIENKPQVNHKDGNKKNNNLENLEWVTDSENKIHCWLNIRHQSI